jgi:hypothetical protein
MKSYGGWKESFERKTELARQILDSRIEAAVAEYAITLMTPDAFPSELLEETLRYLRKYASSLPHPDEHRSTVANVPEARGNFQW